MDRNAEAASAGGGWCSELCVKLEVMTEAEPPAVRAADSATSGGNEWRYLMGRISTISKARLIAQFNDFNDLLERKKRKRKKM